VGWREWASGFLCFRRKGLEEGRLEESTTILAKTRNLTTGSKKRNRGSASATGKFNARALPRNIVAAIKKKGSWFVVEEINNNDGFVEL
jgi:hypothetical protein